MKIQIVIILGLFTFGKYLTSSIALYCPFLTTNLPDYCEDLNCYNCDPKSEGKCVTPKKHNPKITNCEDPSITTFAPNVTKQISNSDQRKIEPQNVEVVTMCFSMYQENELDDAKRGVYRGCIKLSNNILNVCDYMKENLDVRFNITSCITCNKSRCNNLRYLEGGGVALTEENLSDNSNITTCPNCTKSKNNPDYLGGGAAGLTEENLSDNNNTTTCPTENICKLDHLEMGLTVSLVIMIIIQKLLLYYCAILQNSSKE
jgi:hypothetical protein